MTAHGMVALSLNSSNRYLKGSLIFHSRKNYVDLSGSVVVHDQLMFGTLYQITICNYLCAVKNVWLFIHNFYPCHS